MTTANSNEMMNSKYYIDTGCMNRNFFDEYLADNATKAVLQKIREYWSDPEEFLEYSAFRLENPTDRKGLEYSECWLLDYKDGYLPLIATGINTSSRYSMCRCGMDRELDEDEEPQTLTLDEICELMSDKYKTTLKTTVENIEKKTHKIEHLSGETTEDKKEEIPIEMNTTTPKIAPTVPSVPSEEFKKLAEITETAIRGSNAQRNRGSIQVSSELPLYMREGGEAEIEKRRKELETYLKLLNSDPATMINKHTLVILNQATLDAELVGEQQVKDIKKWFANPKTQQEINRWLGCGTHKADGKSWNCGFMGSRWADKMINGRQVRFAFYADKDQKPAHLKHLAYSIVLDPSE